jgi:hypothetical protein
MSLLIKKPTPKTPNEMFRQLSALVVQITEKKEVLSEDEVLGLLIKTYMTMVALWAVSQETFEYAFTNAEYLLGAAVKSKGGVA